MKCSVPPGFRTRRSSASAAAMSGMVHIVHVDSAVSWLSSSSGNRCPSRPLRRPRWTTLRAEWRRAPNRDLLARWPSPRRRPADRRPVVPGAEPDLDDTAVQSLAHSAAQRLGGLHAAGGIDDAWQDSVAVVPHVALRMLDDVVRAYDRSPSPVSRGEVGGTTGEARVPDPTAVPGRPRPASRREPRAAGKDVAMTGGGDDLRPIGWVRSPLVDLADAPKQGDEGAGPAELVFSAEFADGLKDIAVGDSMLLLTWLDRASRDVLVVHPRDDVTRAPRGVFSTALGRSSQSHRPPPCRRHLDPRIDVHGRRTRGHRRYADPRCQADARTGRRAVTIRGLGGHRANSCQGDTTQTRPRSGRRDRPTARHRVSDTCRG